MNNKSLDALFSGLTGTAQPPIPEALPKPRVQSKQVPQAKVAQAPQEKLPEERFCTIVQSDTLRKIRIIANREGLQIKDVVGAAFEKAIKSYERKHGAVDGGMKGDASNLF